MSEKSFFERRHIFLINKEFQGRFAAFVITILIGYSFILLLFQKLSKSVSFPLMIPIVFGILIIFIGVASIFYSHRFAGPLSAINRATKEMTKGDLLIKIHIRKEHNVIFHQIAENINYISSNFRESVLDMEEKLILLSKESQHLSENIAKSKSKTELASQMEKVLKIEKELEAIVRPFKVC